MPRIFVPEKLWFSKTHSGSETSALKTAGGCDDILLMSRRRRELETIPPDDRLLVVAIGPESMEIVVRTDRYVGVIAEEPASEPVSSIDGMCSHRVSSTGGQVCHHVIEPGIINVWAESEAVDPAHSGRRCGRGARLPWRYNIRCVGRHVDKTGWGNGHRREERVNSAVGWSIQPCHRVA